MVAVREKYLVDEQGRRKAVVLSLAKWKKMVEALEELEDIRAYDAAERRPSQPVPFEEAVRKLRRGKVR
jgi:PHD/YefM family antitoxin component YafN of YafNO toxin-antitoxin module